MISSVDQTNQSLTMLLQDPSIRTLNLAMMALYSQPLPWIRWRQQIDLRNIYMDLAFSQYIIYHVEHETVRITFPPECHSIAAISNSHGCKMVYYETMDGLTKEARIDPQTQIFIRPKTEIIVYTQSIRDLVIAFDMIMIKPSHRSKL